MLILQGCARFAGVCSANEEQTSIAAETINHLKKGQNEKQNDKYLPLQVMCNNLKAETKGASELHAPSVQIFYHVAQEEDWPKQFGVCVRV